MKRNCPRNECASTQIVKNGSYRRSSDSRNIQRFLCRECGKNFSASTSTLEYYQKKRRLNFPLFKYLAEGGTQRGAARFFNVSRKTIENRVPFLGKWAKQMNQEFLKGRKFKEIQFDELITFEHTKCKPIAVGAIVSSDLTTILATEARQIPANGSLAEVSIKKYGQRQSEKVDGIVSVFSRAAKYLVNNFELSTDLDWAYRPLAIQVFHRKMKMKYTHHEYKSRKARGQGFGELKGGNADPLFAINHTFAKFRAFQSRLARRTWNTTKKIENLRHQLEIYTYYHNQ